MKFLSLLFTTWILLVVVTVKALNKHEKLKHEAYEKVKRSGYKFAREFSNLVFVNHKNDNVICSPLGARVAFAAITMGARKRSGTYEQLRDALNLPIKRETNTKGFKLLLEKITEAKNVNLRIPSVVYVSKNYTIRKNRFLSWLNTYFSTDVSYLKIIPRVSIKVANKWASDKTNKIFDEVLKKGDIVQKSRIVVVNVNYFIANWEQPFNPACTKIKQFHGFGGLNFLVPTMFNAKVNFSNGKLDNYDAQYIELPYKNSDYKMVIFVPSRNEKKQFDELGRYLKNFDYDLFGSSRKIFSEESIEMPKFMIENTIDLRMILKQMNATDMLDGKKSNFKDIVLNSRPKLRIDTAVQKVMIAVDETATGVKTSASSVRPNEKIFSSEATLKIDKPFYFAITSTHGVIFQGNVKIPRYPEE